METIKFTPPEVTEEKVEEIPPPQEKLTETHVAEETQKGDPDALVIAETNNAVIEDNNIYDLVAIQEQPGFPGGEGELFNFLHKNTVYPQVEKENGIQGKVFITFVVDKDGSVTDVSLYRGLKGGAGCDKEALRVVKLMPKWSPGKQNGKAVKVRYILPINFKLN
jgi:protein TonB